MLAADLKRALLKFLAGIGFLSLSGWAVLAVVCSNFPAGARYAAAAVFVIAAAGSLILPKRNGGKMIWFAVLFALVLVWWLLLPPSNFRDWAPDVAVLPFADIGASSVTVHNIRNCDYRTEQDYTVRHYDESFSLDSLDSLDLFLVDWGLPHLAHAMLSFGFGGAKHLCFSIETRRKKGEEYSSLRGLFRQYELTYVIGDERDLVRLRANYRQGEDVYLYRIRADKEIIRHIFLDYLRTVNSLKEKPRWYNAVTANCTTAIRGHVVPYYPRAKLDWRILASGHIPEMLYDLGVVDTTLPLREFKRRSLISERSRAAGADQDYPALIRRGLPGF